MIVVSYRGHSEINDGVNYTSGVLAPVHGLPEIRALRLERAGRWPVVSGVERAGRTLVVDIVLEGADTGALQNQLSRWFDPEDETPGQLIVADNDGGNQRYVMALCEQLVEDEESGGRSFSAIMAVDGDVRWRSAVAAEEAWAVTASGQTTTISNDGPDDAYPVITVTPTAAKVGGYAYRRSLFVRWRVSGGATRYPLDVVNDGLDTAALVADTTRSVLVNNGAGINDSVTTIPYDGETGTFPSAGLAYVGTEQIRYTGKTGTDLTGVTRGVNGTSAASHADNAVIAASKIKADGDDLRLLVNGVEVDRWLDDPNDSTTKVWANLDFEGKQEVDLGVAIAGSGAVETVDVVGKIDGFPAAGAFMVDDELFVYTSKNNSLQRFLGVTRAARGTAEAAHSVGADVWWVQHDLALVYGNADAGSPTVDDDLEPVFDLGASFNSTLVWELFGEDDSLRPGSWVVQEQAIEPRNRLEFYTDDQYTYVNPWEELGIHLQTLWQSPFGWGRWGYYNPCGITEIVNVAGERYCLRSPSTEWRGEMQWSGNGFDWETAVSIGVPTTPNTWGSWSDSTVALGSGARWVGLFLGIPEAKGAVDTRRVEMDVIGLELDLYPTVTVGGEVGNYSLSCVITNNETGDSIGLDFVMGVDVGLVVDTDEKTVVYDADGSGQFQALTVVGGARRHWLRLVPGENELAFVDVGTVGVDVTVSFRERWYG